MEGISYGERDLGRDPLDHLHDALEDPFGINLMPKRVRTFLEEARELRFKIIDVMIGPVDL